MRSGIHRFLADLHRDTPVFRVQPGTPVDITSDIPGVPFSVKWPPDCMRLSRSFAIPARTDLLGRYTVPRQHLLWELDRQLGLWELPRSSIHQVELSCWVATAAIVVHISCWAPWTPWAP